MQLWSQSMQDLGVREDILWKKDFDIPDVDITFSNFEELFEGDEDLIGALLDDKDLSCSSVEKTLSLDRSDNNNAREKDVCLKFPGIYFISLLEHKKKREHMSNKQIVNPLFKLHFVVCGRFLQFEQLNNASSLYITFICQLLVAA